MLSADEIRANLDAVRARVDAACARAGRQRDEVTLVAVTKTFPAEAVDAAIAAGATDIGENRVQEARDKQP
ncbi:MAG TPA: YggS family pyridoxal phosphate-dependent enzyme, partial [Thermoanaerobaculia bacterium]|nr:YggS family pyridoxal phosphate-dependent enzyme [Thermoanaerobaculia bacterium]